jgi:hypothetical protein
LRVGTAGAGDAAPCGEQFDDWMAPAFLVFIKADGAAVHALIVYHYEFAGSDLLRDILGVNRDEALGEGSA